MDHDRLVLFEGNLTLFKRKRSRFWQCYAHLGGAAYRRSTKQEVISHAKEVAEDWYFELRAKHRAGQFSADALPEMAPPPGVRGSPYRAVAKPAGKTFREAAEKFREEYQVITQGQRSAKYVELQEMRLDVHLLPFFGPMALSEITPGTAQDYRIHRSRTSRTGKPLARSTIHQEIVALRQVLKTANRHGWIPFVPDLSPPYKASGKIGHRAWFSPAEYKQLYMAIRRRIKEPLKERWHEAARDLLDYVLFMANTGLRPDEAKHVEFRDVTIVDDEDSGETILNIEVRGKRGLGYCKSMNGAVRPFERLRERRSPQPTDLVFPSDQRELFNTILDEEGLKLDRQGNRRTAYSLRHSYICFRLTEGADPYQIAKNCRTSIEMIQKFYAVHIKNSLNAAVINVRRPKPKKPVKALTAAKTTKSRRSFRWRKKPDGI